MQDVHCENWGSTSSALAKLKKLAGYWCKCLFARVNTHLRATTGHARYLYFRIVGLEMTRAVAALRAAHGGAGGTARDNTERCVAC